MSTRRHTLSRFSPNNADHPGLWFDKFFAGSFEENSDQPKSALVLETTGIRPVGYKAQFDRWVRTLQEMGAILYEAQTLGRLSIGLGSASVIETAVSIHRTYGVPYIPGSALKGMAAHYAHQYQPDVWSKNGDAHKTLFGTTDSAGYVTFLDALPLPSKWQLHQDTITVHHPDYYKGENKAPADWDSPNPVPFLSVSGTFLIVLHAPDAPAWGARGIEILREALKDVGIGAKTSSGYGRMRLNQDPVPPPFKLQAGLLIRTKIIEVWDDGLDLEPHKSLLQQLDTDKDVFLIVPQEHRGTIPYQVGHGLRCIVLDVYEDEYEITITCRPATREERN